MAAAVAALLFAVHPVHTEAVTGVVGRAELLASVFFLLALLQYASISRGRAGASVRWRGLMTVCLLIAVSMLCKEQGITVIAVCVVHEVCVAQCAATPRDLLRLAAAATKTGPPAPAWLKRVLVLGGAGAGLMAARLRVMGATLPVFTKYDNPAAAAPSPARQLTFNYLASVNWGLLAAPASLCCDWTMSSVELVTSLADPRNLATMALYALLAHLLYSGTLAAPSHRDTSVIVTGLSLLVCPFLPASNLLFPVGFVVAERILYLPSMGFCLLVAHGCDKLWRRSGAWRHLVAAGLLATAAAHSMKTVTRNADWVDEFSLFSSGLKVNSGNAKLFNNVGHALEAGARHEEALHYFRAAVRVQPDDIGAHINIGRSFNHLGRLHEAETAYLAAKALLPKPKKGESYQARVAPNHLNVFLNLATLIAKNESRLEEADFLYRQAISMRSDYTQAYINRGDILIKLNRTKEAQEVYERALAFDSSNADIYYNLGVVLLEQGRHAQALAYLDRALQLEPEHAQALLNSAMLIQETGNTQLRATALARLHTLVAKGKANERVYFNLGMLAMDEKDLGKAELWFRKAIELKPDFRSALFNLALLLSDSGRPLEAAPLLHQLLHHHGHHVKGLILLGDIYINHIRDLEAAEDCYNRILAQDPGHVQGLHNLRVVMVERGNLGAARDCLRSAHALAPYEDYIARHLDIIEKKIAETSSKAAAAGRQEP